MYDLQEMFNASVLMNKEAIQDEAIMNVLTNASNDNFEFKNVSCDHVTFDEFICDEHLDNYGEEFGW